MAIVGLRSGKTSAPHELTLRRDSVSPAIGTSPASSQSKVWWRYYHEALSANPDRRRAPDAAPPGTAPCSAPTPPAAHRQGAARPTLSCVAACGVSRQYLPQPVRGGVVTSGALAIRRPGRFGRLHRRSAVATGRGGSGRALRRGPLRPPVAARDRRTGVHGRPHRRHGSPPAPRDLRAVRTGRARRVAARRFGPAAERKSYDP